MALLNHRGEYLKSVLKNAASGVLAHWPCSRTPAYAPLVQAAAALLDWPFFTFSSIPLVRLDHSYVEETAK